LLLFKSEEAEKKVESKSEIDLSFVVANDILDISTCTKKKEKKKREDV